MRPANPALIRQSETHAAFLAIRLTSLAQIIRITPANSDPAIDVETIRRTLHAFAQEGVARGAAAIGDHLNLAQITDALTEALAAVEASPLPAREWAPMSDLLGDDLGSLVGASGSSIHRYRNNARETPDHIAARLHAVTLIVADLAGSYNAFGIRRWFGRPRTPLDGRSPAAIMSGDWDPHDADIIQVRELAASLLAPLST